MFSRSNYIAVIKWKRGERGALQDLDQKILSNIIPLIEIQPIPYDHDDKVFKRTIDQHLGDTGENLAECWGRNTVFVDGYTLYDDKRIDKNIKMSNGMSPLEFVIEDIEKQNISTIPVTTLSRPIDYNFSIQNCLSKFQNNLAIRIYLKDLLDVSKFQMELDNLLSFFKMPRDKVHIFLDLAEINYNFQNNGTILIDQKTLDEYIQNITTNINALPYLNEWNTFTILCTSVINNFSSVKVSTNCELPRLEWHIYKNLLACELKRMPNYGDYTVSSPDWFDFNPRRMPVSVNVKYTVENKYLIFKGVSVNSAGNDQIYSLCQLVIKHPEYCGRTYSAGDEFIYQCGKAIRPTPGNQETRIRYWVNHHLTLVSNCLTNLHVNVTS